MSTTELSPEVLAAFERRAARGHTIGADEVVAAVSAETDDGPGGAARLEELQTIERAGTRSSMWSRRSVLVAVAALVALIVGTTVVMTRRDRPADVVDTPGPPATSDGAWHELGRLSGPIDASGYPLTPLVVGDRLVLPGLLGRADNIGRVGETPVLDLDTGVWRTLPAPPGTTFASVQQPVPVAIDDAAVVFGVGPRPAGAPDGGEGPPVGLALDVDLGTWRETGSIPGTPSGTVWTGHEVLAWASGYGLLAWHPGESEWSSWGHPQSGANGSTQIVWTGTQAVLITGATTAAVARDGSWQELAEPPASHQAVVWTGSEVAALGGDGELSTLDPTTGAWRERTAAPFQGRSIRDVTVGLPGRVAVLGGLQFDYSPGSAPPSQAIESSVWDAATDSWSPLPALPDDIDGVAAAVADGDRVIAIAAGSDGSLVVLALDLGPVAPPASGAPQPANTASFGAAAIDLPVPPASDGRPVRLVLGAVPSGFERGPGVASGTNTPPVLDSVDLVGTSPTDSRILTVILTRLAIPEGLFNAWRAQDRDALLAAARGFAPLDQDDRTSIAELGSRPVFHIADPTAPPGAQHRMIVLVTGPDSMLTLRTRGLTDDEVDAVVQGLRVEVG